MEEDSLFSTPSLAFIVCRLFDDGHLEGCEVISYCSFDLHLLEKTLESPLDSKEIKPVNPKINPEYSLQGLMLKLKLQYFGHLM